MIEKKAQGGNGGGGQIYDLVTEEENGIARAFDKRVLDHSLHNVAQMGAEHDEVDAVRKLTDVDEMYREEYGQFLGWRNEEGNPILSRCAYDPNWTLPSIQTWVDGAYDEVHGTLCILCVGENGQVQGEEGDFLVATRKIRGPWELRRMEYYERWIGITAGNGTLVAITGNQSREYAISTDGGFVWNTGVFPYYKEMLKCRYIDGKFYIICKDGYFYTEDFDSYSSFNNVTGLLDICKDSGGLVLFTYDNATYTLDRRIYGGQDATLYDNHNTYKYSLDELYFFRDGYFLATSRGGVKYEGSATTPLTLLAKDNGNGTMTINTGAWIRPQDGETLVQGLPYIRPNYDEARELQYFASFYKDGEVRIVYEAFNTVSNFAQQIEWKRMSDADPTYLVPCTLKNEDRAVLDEYHCMFYFGGGILKYGGVKAESDYGYMETVISTDAGYLKSEYDPLNKWEVIPLPNEFQNGMIAVKDREVKEVEVREPYLQYRDLTLKANESDRYTPYQNHRLYRTVDGVTEEIWCRADWNNIVDGVTEVYSDEACSTQVGIIRAHNYNINNPYDTLVFDGSSDIVYEWDPLYYPLTLATSKAIIEALMNIDLSSKLGYWTGDQDAYDALDPDEKDIPNVLYAIID